MHERAGHDDRLDSLQRDGLRRALEISQVEIDGFSYSRGGVKNQIPQVELVNVAAEASDKATVRLVSPRGKEIVPQSTWQTVITWTSEQGDRRGQSALNPSGWLERLRGGDVGH